MKSIVAGIVAHVDAGKTTLSEGMLFEAGELRKLGRVDNGDAFLDPEDLEKQRGITIFSHMAKLKFNNLDLTLLDTPGHADFASQTEQVLSVLDYAVLVVSATDGVTGYTRTLWNLLQTYQVPTFIFVNKMDTITANASQSLIQLQQELSEGCLAFDKLDLETIAMQDDQALEEYMSTDSLSDLTIQKLIQQRQIFPVYFGAALKQQGIVELLTGMEKWTLEMETKREFGARVFKISYDTKGDRLTWLRLTGGQLKVKDLIVGEQKANQLRTYSGNKFSVVSEVVAGQVVAVPGLTATYPGQGIGDKSDTVAPLIQPVLNYSVNLNDNDLQNVLTALRQLEDEDPLLNVIWQSESQEIQIQIMGNMQLEIIQQILMERFNLEVTFDKGSIVYKETVTKSIEGVGHFEPLRHYAEAHLLIEPLPRGSGIKLALDCPQEVLSINWQHQVLANLQSKPQLGVLTGSLLTDVQITLVTGRASNVHTVGGDFREATWRALRQGLMMLKAQDGLALLEPWYQFTLVVGKDQVGRAINDIQRMDGKFNLESETNDQTMVTITGKAPVAEMQDYAQTVNGYTHGQGSLECIFSGYQVAHNASEVIDGLQYDPVADVSNTPDSVFCAHGAGYPVKWDQVPEMAHVAYRYPIA